MMKKILLVSSLLFLSITAIAESNLRCEFHKSSTEIEHEIHKQFLTYTKKVFRKGILDFSLGEDEPELPLIAKHEYLCTKLN